MVVFSQYESEREAGEHVGILMNPEMSLATCRSPLASTVWRSFSQSGWRKCWAGSHRAA